MARQPSLLKPLRIFLLKTNIHLKAILFSCRKNFILFKLRTRNHKLPVETGRWDGLDISERKCSLCTRNDIGDEFHYILKCPYFHTERQLYLKSYYIQRPNMFKFGELLKTKSTSVLTKLSKFTELIIKTFESLYY